MIAIVKIGKLRYNIFILVNVFAFSFFSLYSLTTMSYELPLSVNASILYFLYSDSSSYSLGLNFLSDNLFFISKKLNDSYLFDNNITIKNFGDNLFAEWFVEGTYKYCAATLADIHIFFKEINIGKKSSYFISHNKLLLVQGSTILIYDGHVLSVKLENPYPGELNAGYIDKNGTLFLNDIFDSSEVATPT